jgi:hypothetical protein
MPFTPQVAAHAGTEHPLLGLLAQQPGLAALALAELGLDPQPRKPTLPSRRRGQPQFFMIRSYYKKLWQFCRGGKT